MKPSNEELARLIPEADAALADQSIHKDGSLEHKVSWTNVLISDMSRVARSPSPQWLTLRLLALRALYLCALIAWEAGRRASPFTASPVEARMFVNDGNGGMRPLDGPADEPAAKSVDVDALLAWADRVPVLSWGNSEIASNVALLATALRAEQERSYEANNSAYDAEQRMLASYGHLRAVLGFMWPGSGGPTVVQKARAFLAGEEQAPQEELKRALDDAEMMRDSYRRKHLAACERISELSREKSLLEKELADKGVTMSTPTEDKAHWQGTVRVLEDLVGRIQGELIAEQTAHRTTKGALDDARAAIAAEDEAHAHTMAQLADAKGGLAAAGREVERLQGVATAALAAQNLAEIEAASLRIEVADLSRKLAEGDLMVDQLVAWSKKGRA